MLKHYLYGTSSTTQQHNRLGITVSNGRLVPSNAALLQRIIDLSPLTIRAHVLCGSKSVCRQWRRRSEEEEEEEEEEAEAGHVWRVACCDSCEREALHTVPFLNRK